MRDVEVKNHYLLMQGNSDITTSVASGHIGTYNTQKQFKNITKYSVQILVEEEGFNSHYKLVPLLNGKDSFDIYYH